MMRSTHRILTTHAGSLPRPDDLRALVTAKAGRQPYAEDALACDHSFSGGPRSGPGSSLGFCVSVRAKWAKPHQSDVGEDRCLDYGGDEKCDPREAIRCEKT